MRARRVFVLAPMICLLALVTVAQNHRNSIDKSDFPRFTIARFAPQNAGLHLINNSAYDGQGFVLPPNTPGESSSRKHSRSTAVPVKQAVGVQDTNTTHCEEPARLFSAHDYTGPLNRFAAWFTRKPEMTTVPKRNGGQNVCTLDVGEKFQLFYKTTVDPVTFVGAGVVAGYSQWQNDDKEWGQGAEGYGKRYAAALTDRVTRNFFGQFFYPSIFSQDPRYYRKGTGETRARLIQAVSHTFVTRTDSGGTFANLSLWFGTASTVAVENLYHPGNDRGFGPAAERTGISLGKAMGWDVLREFWPEIVRTLRLPFRERHVVPTPATANP